MILIDTHIWLWWINGSPQLRPHHSRILRENQESGIGVSAISCWEVAMLASRSKIGLGMPIEDWINSALTAVGVRLMPLSPAIAIDANFLPGTFHRDPADQILVATARVQNLPFLTEDAKILAYPHVILAR